MTNHFPIKSKKDNDNKIVTIMAGGTGGHIFPGLAVANALIAQDWKVTWLGSAGGMEEEIVRKRNIDIDVIDVSGLRGKGPIGWLKAPFTLLYSIYQAVKILQRTKSSLILGFGGFASGPGGFAAYLLGKTLFIHEQNAIAGMTNRLLAIFSKRIFLAFPNAITKINKTQVTGNPIRENIRMINKTKIVKIGDSVNLLIIGGSRGALAFNQKLPAVLGSLVKQNMININHQCGKGNLEETIMQYKNESMLMDEKVTVTEFIDDMTSVYEWADIVICRSGALTVSEIAVVGIASILVPFPHAADDHQTLNAKWLADSNAAIIIQQSDIEMATTKQQIISLVTEPNRLNKMAKNARLAAYMNATNEIVDACNQSVREVA